MSATAVVATTAAGTIGGALPAAAAPSGSASQAQPATVDASTGTVPAPQSEAITSATATARQTGQRAEVPALETTDRKVYADAPARSQ